MVDGQSPLQPLFHNPKVGWTRRVSERPGIKPSGHEGLVVREIHHRANAVGTDQLRAAQGSLSGHVSRFGRSG